MNKIQSIYNKSNSLKDFKMKLVNKIETDKTLYKEVKTVDEREFEPAMAKVLREIKNVAEKPLSKDEEKLIRQIEDRHGD